MLSSKEDSKKSPDCQGITYEVRILGGFFEKKSPRNRQHASRSDHKPGNDPPTIDPDLGLILRVWPTSDKGCQELRPMTSPIFSTKTPGLIQGVGWAFAFFMFK